jgi:hypothetical protein
MKLIRAFALRVCGLSLKQETHRVYIHSARCDDFAMFKAALMTATLLPSLLFTACLSPHGAQNNAKQNIPTKSWEEVSSDAAASSGIYDEGYEIGTVTERELSEISGITASRVTPDVWWVHNDSGDRARIFAINSSGKLLATFDVLSATNVDWEDIAAGKAPDGRPALYLADIGNNYLDREEMTIYRVREPKLADGVKSGLTETAESFHFRYPDGRHDAEAVFVDPQSERIYVITKTLRESCHVYRFPQAPRAGEHVTLERVTGRHIEAIERLRLVTGAATSPDGTRVVIRTYFSAFEFQRAKNEPFESLFDREPVIVKIPQTRQGEAIAYSADGQSVVTTSEKLPAPLHRMTRK